MNLPWLAVGIAIGIAMDSILIGVALGVALILIFADNDEIEP